MLKEDTAQGRYGELLLEYRAVNPHLSLHEAQDALDQVLRVQADFQLNQNGSNNA